METRIPSGQAKPAPRSGSAGEAKSHPGPAGRVGRSFSWRRFFDEQVRGQSTVSHRSVWDYLGYTGTIALVLLVLQAISGGFLLLYYEPRPDRAFASLQMIRNEVPFGLFYSSLHAINAKLLILTLFIHLFRVMLISAHRGPRQRQWQLGVILLALMLLAGFTGYLLPWSQQSYWAGVIGLEALRSAPLVGGALAALLRGGENVTGVTLHRFFDLHVILLPAAILVLAWMHVKRVWKTGVIAPVDAYASVMEADCIGCGKCAQECSFHAVKMTVKPQRELPVIDKELCNACRACVKVCPPECITFQSDRRPFLSEPIFPNHVIHRIKGVTLGLLTLAFSVFFLHGLLMGEKAPADPMLTPDQIKPDWYFLAAYQVLRKLPSKQLGLLVLLGLLILVFFLPAIDRSGPRDPARRPVYIFLVTAGIVSFIVLSVMGYF